MLSRLASRAELMRWVPRVQQAQQVTLLRLVPKQGVNTPALALLTNNAAVKAAAAAPAANPERDLVNFPRREKPIDRPKVRLGFLPEEWFLALQEKTGVSGGYAFIGAFGTFVLSKELLVLDHEFMVFKDYMMLFILAITLYKADFTAYFYKLMDERDAMLRASRQNEIDRCQAAIGEEEKSQLMASSYEALIAARKENVALQLEAAYRERLQTAHQQVKLRLDYQLEKANVMRRTEQKHMVDWIINSVKSSITAKQEDEALKKCVADLKGLAAVAK